MNDVEYILDFAAKLGSRMLRAGANLEIQLIMLLFLQIGDGGK